MLGTTSASQAGVKGCTSPWRASSVRASGTSRSLSADRASSPITTTMRGCTMASSSTTRARQAGSAITGSATGHFASRVPYTASGSMPRRLKDFISAVPLRP